ncbi:MAG TPA: lipopolysaccharide heptosyltransferase II [Armatimonadota bacterium]|nr:lipopolysaccharide heptosyltransferase II [Armatimonadota bacterium]
MTPVPHQPAGPLVHASAINERALTTQKVDRRRILIVKLSSIGDVVHALPVARSLRLGFPDAYICWAVHRSCREVVEGNPYLDEVFVLEEKTLGRLFRAGIQLRAKGFDTAIDLQGLFVSGLLTWLSGSRDRIGFIGNQEMRRLFINRPSVRSNRRMLPPYCYMEFAVAAGGPSLEPAPEIFVSAEHRRAAGELLAPALSRGGPIVALNPGARWDTKRWSIEGFAAVADQLMDEHGAEVVIIGGPGDRPLADAIAAKMRSNPLSIAGQTSLKTLAAVFERSAIYLGGDTGPMHIAAAMGTPVLAIFGPTDPEKTGPVGAPYRIIRHEVPCGPCRLHECGHHTCMRRVTPEEVTAAALELIRSPVLRAPREE